MKRLFTICMLVLLAVSTASAQRRMPCTSVSQGALTRGTYYALPEPITKWDSHRVYRQPVVLIAFKDMNFSMSDPVTYYNRLLNEEGFNEGVGKGCVADYFREQSGGLLNLQFDVYGPFQVDTIAKGKGSSNDGEYPMMKAMEQLRVSCDADFSVYDWDGDGKVNQVVFIAAGYSGNDNTGYIWPNTYSCGFKAPGGLGIQTRTISCEKWKNDRLCGIGTICHEFAHSLGLPDIYPANVYGGVFSVVDEWDLMDGGNYTNYGWCPPNFSAMEKMFLGWSSPIELTTATTITGMKPVSEGGETYLIRNSGYENEFYLLENRRQTGWDYAAPGNGLLIFHVDYNYGMWLNNIVNTSMEHFCYDLFHADNKDYLIWDPDNNGKDPNKWTMTDRMRNSYLSTSAYPYTDPVSLVVNASLTDGTEPASMVYKGYYEIVVEVDEKTGKKTGEKTVWYPGMMSKSITNIRMADDGTISFDFMGGTSGIHPIEVIDDDNHWYDLQGRRLQGQPSRKGVYIHNRKKVAL